MSKVLYVEACGGASGDMLAGGLLDLGWPLQELRGQLATMGLGQVKVEVAVQEHQGIMTRRLVVEAPEEQAHRRLSHILELLGRLPYQVAEPASRVFERLARAEAQVHGATLEEVHFHEVGALDAIADVVAFCTGLAWLGGPRLVCSPLPMGQGFVHCAHGKLPLPAPAVLRLLEGAPVYASGVQGETVTPTGAALLTTLAQEFGPPPAMRLEKSGFGGGSRPSQEIPNLLRLWLGQEEMAAGRDRVVEIVCHLDDMNPEDLPLVLERLMAAGALDAAAAPLVMKKGRLGQSLTVLSTPEKSEALAALVLEETPSLGVRLRPLERWVLAREVVTVESPWGPAKVKRARTAQGWRLHAEAEEVARICRQSGLPPWRVRRQLEDLAGELA